MALVSRSRVLYKLVPFQSSFVKTSRSNTQPKSTKLIAIHRFCRRCDYNLKAKDLKRCPYLFFSFQRICIYFANKVAFGNCKNVFSHNQKINQAVISQLRKRQNVFQSEKFSNQKFESKYDPLQLNGFTLVCKRMSLKMFFRFETLKSP